MKQHSTNKKQSLWNTQMLISPQKKKPNGKSKIIEWFDLIWVGSRRCYIEIYNLKMVKYQGQNWAFHDISLNLKNMNGTIWKRTNKMHTIIKILWCRLPFWLWTPKEQKIFFDCGTFFNLTFFLIIQKQEALNITQLK